MLSMLSTNFSLQHRPVTPGWRVWRTSCWAYFIFGLTFCILRPLWRARLTCSTKTTAKNTRAISAICFQWTVNKTGKYLSTSYTQSEPHICPKTQNFQRVRLMSLAHLSAEPFLVCGSCTPAMLTSTSPAPGAGSVLQQWWPSVAWPAVLGNRPTSTTRSMRDENQHHWLIPKLPTLLTSVTQTTSNGKWNIIWPEAG